VFGLICLRNDSVSPFDSETLRKSVLILVNLLSEVAAHVTTIENYHRLSAFIWYVAVISVAVMTKQQSYGRVALDHSE
jgi:hypothetical protein